MQLARKRPCSLHGSAPAVMHGSAPAACMEAPHSSPGGSGGQRTSPIDSLRPGAGVSGSVTFDRSRSSHAGVAIVRTDDACRTCVAFVWGGARGTPQATRIFTDVFSVPRPNNFLSSFACLVAVCSRFSGLSFVLRDAGRRFACWRGGRCDCPVFQTVQCGSTAPKHCRGFSLGSVCSCRQDCGGHIRGMCFLRRGF